MLTILIVIISFSIIILIHEAGHLFAAKKCGVKVEAFSLGMGKRLFGIKIGETDYRISLVPFGGFCQMAGEDPNEAMGHKDEFSSKTIGQRFWIIVSGSLANYILAFVIFSVIFMIGAPTLTNKIGQVMSGYPAEKAGIKAGDRIISIDGENVKYWDNIVGIIKEEASEGRIMDLEIMRNNRRISLEIIPEISSVKNIFGQTISRPMIGIAPQDEILSISYNPFQAIYYGGKRLVTLTLTTYKGLWLIMTGGMPLKSSVAGPIGIAQLMGQAARLGIVPLLLILAHVNMVIAIFNLLPFPVLDGGHILFLGIERLRGKPINPRTQEIITQVAVVLLIAFAVAVSWQDVMRLRGK